MEAVVPESESIPFQPGARGHLAVTYADQAWLRVQKKIAKYGLRHAIPIDLLIYITHEQDVPGRAEILTLRHYFKEREHSFYYVFFLLPLTEDDIQLYVLFNRDLPFDNLPPIDQLVQQYRIVLPPGGWQVEPSDVEAAQETN